MIGNIFLLDKSGELSLV